MSTQILKVYSQLDATRRTKYLSFLVRITSNHTSILNKSYMFDAPLAYLIYNTHFCIKFKTQTQQAMERLTTIQTQVYNERRDEHLAGFGKQFENAITQIEKMANMDNCRSIVVYNGETMDRVVSVVKSNYDFGAASVLPKHSRGYKIDSPVMFGIAMNRQTVKVEVVTKSTDNYEKIEVHYFHFLWDDRFEDIVIVVDHVFGKDYNVFDAVDVVGNIDNVDKLVVTIEDGEDTKAAYGRESSNEIAAIMGDIACNIEDVDGFNPIFCEGSVVAIVDGVVKCASTEQEFVAVFGKWIKAGSFKVDNDLFNHVSFIAIDSYECFYANDIRALNRLTTAYYKPVLIDSSSETVAETVDAKETETENQSINNYLRENSIENLANIETNEVSLQKETETTSTTGETNNTNTNIQNSNKMETMNVNNANETKKQSAKQAIKELAKSANESNVNNIRAYFGEITDEQAQLIHGTISHFDVDAPSVGVLVYSYMFIEYISCSKSELKKHVQFAASNVDAKKAVFEALKSLGGAVLPEQVAEKERAYYAAKDERRALQNFVAEYSTYKKALKIVREIIDGDFTCEKGAKQTSETKTINAAIKSVKNFWREEKYSLSGAIRRTVKVFNEFINVDETTEDNERIEAVKLFASKGLVDYKAFSEFVTYDLVISAFGYKVASNGDKICFRNGKLKEKFSETDVITAVAITLKGKQVGEIKE